ncbi:MAG TPA: transglutaminase family protein [Terriglobales bacterium]|jgi:transglutaminase-like putative cysteine protease|nr:transglutaminase family protein [Terriglobales bacterium]
MSEKATSARRYRVTHHSAYAYSEPVTLSHQQLHLTPRALDRQVYRDYQITISPTPTRRSDGVDPFGNPVTEITIETAHTAVDIVAGGTVEVSTGEVPEAAASPPWEEVRRRFAYHAGWKPNPAVLEATRFLFESQHARVKRDLRAYAGDCFDPGRPLLDAARLLMGKIHRDFKYDPAATTVTTPVMKFFEQKRGVCQDYAHLMISCLRSTGLAARYVSGYLLTRPAPGKERRVGADASHAWVSVFVPDTGWVDFDPTNNILSSSEHITLGWGRDFADVTPLRGVINGGGQQTLEIKVTVEPVGESPAS